MVEKIRRVVTGHDEDGKAVFISDGDATAVKEMESMPGLAITDLWRMDAVPTSNAGNDDAVDPDVVLLPPSSGVVFRVVEFPPDSNWRGAADGKAAFASIGAEDAQDHDSDDPMRHRTDTVDLLMVLKGSIVAVLDDGARVTLEQGDTFIQRGTIHSWEVPGDEPCLLGAVLVDAEPLGA